MNREQLIGLLSSSARLMDERDDMKEYIDTLEEDQGLSEKEIRGGYEAFKARKQAEAVARIAQKHALSADALQGFIDQIMDRYIFDPDALTDLFAHLGLGWKARAKKELELMEDVTPLLRRLAGGREISGLEVYDA
jgi:type I restriction enzyme R subunit